MSAKAIREACGKGLLNKFLSGVADPCQYASVNENTDWDKLVQENPWLKTKVTLIIYKGNLIIFLEYHSFMFILPETIDNLKDLILI